MKSLSRRIIVGSVYASAFIPLTFLNVFVFPAIVSKALAFVCLTFLMTGAWIWRVWNKKDNKFSYSYLQILWLLLFFVLLVTSLLGQNLGLSFWGDINRTEGLFLFSMIGIWLSVSTTTLMRKEWEYFLVFVVGAGALGSIIGLFQYMDLPEGVDRVNVLFLNSLYLAEYLLFIFGLSVFLAFGANSLGVRAFYGGAALLALIVIVGTASRSTILGILSGALVAGILVVVSRAVSAKKRLAAAGFLVLCCLGATGVYVGQQLPIAKDVLILRRFSEVLKTPVEDQPRYYFAQAAVKGFKERPWGYGLEGFRGVADRFLTTSYADTQAVSYAEQWPDRIHNTYLEMLLAGGIPAALLYLALVLYGLWLLYRYTDLEFRLRIILASLLIAFAIEGLFVFDTLMSLLLLVSVLAFVQTHGSMRTWTVFHGLLLKGGAALLCLFLLCSGWYFGGRIVFAYRALAASKTFATKVDEGTRAYGVLVSDTAIGADKQYGCQEFFVRAEEALQKGRVTPGTEGLTSLLATASHLWQVCEANASARLAYQAGAFFRAAQEADEAKDILLRAQELAPEKPIVVLELARAYRDQHNFEKLKELSELVWFGNKGNAEASLLYAAALLYDGKEKEANAVLIEVFKTISINHPDLIRAYVDLKRYKDAESILRGTLKGNEKNIWAWLVLAEVEYRAGDTKAALATLKKGEGYTKAQKELADALKSSIEGGGNFSVLLSW